MSEPIIMRRRVYFGGFEKCGFLAQAPLYLAKEDSEALERDGAVIAQDGYEYQLLQPAAEEGGAQ